MDEKFIEKLYKENPNITLKEVLLRLHEEYRTSNVGVIVEHYAKKVLGNDYDEIRIYHCYCVGAAMTAHEMRFLDFLDDLDNLLLFAWKNSLSLHSQICGIIRSHLPMP